MSTPKNIVVLSATGNSGTVLVHHLLAKGHHVTAVARPSVRLDALSQAGATSAASNLQDTGFLTGALRYVPFSYEEAKKGMTEAGMSERMADLYNELTRSMNQEKALVHKKRTAARKTPTTREEFAQTVFAPAFKRLFFCVFASMFLISSCQKEEVQRNCLALESSYTTTNEILAPAPMLQQRITGTGNSTHLGSSEHVALVTVDFTIPPPFKLVGTGTFSTADGDEFYTAFTGIISPNSDGTSNVIINHDINGGTGRFTRATGTLIANLIADPTKSTGLTTSEGQLCY